MTFNFAHQNAPTKPFDIITDIPAQHNLYMYDRWRNKVFDKVYPIHFFGTGSSGNSLLLEPLRLIIDLGFPYKKYVALDPNFFSEIRYIILTHEHGDHLNPATMMRILKLHQNIKFLISPRMFGHITGPAFNKAQRTSGLSTANQQKLLTDYQDRFIILGRSPLLLYSNSQGYERYPYTFTPYITKHGDITNIAIELSCPELGLHLLYSSDLDNLDADPTGITDGLPQKLDQPFNLMFLEANYDKDIVEYVIQHGDYKAKAKAEGNKRHISEQAAWSYVNQHLSNDGVFIPLHASTTYGTLVQNLDF